MKMLKKDIEHLEKSASELMDKCEESRLHIQANSFRRTVETGRKNSWVKQLCTIFLFSVIVFPFLKKSLESP